MLPHMVSVAVIGSGISGLMCAQTILRQSPGVTVAVYEWGRGPGGRTARRRIAINETCSVSFDHAAPFFAASTGAFSDSVLKDWIDRGIAARWNGHSAKFVREGEPTPASRADDYARFTGVPTMHSICRALSEEVVSAGGEMLFGRHVLSANFAGDGEGRWRVVANNRFAETGLQREERNFDAIVLSDKLLVLPNSMRCFPSPTLVLLRCHSLHLRRALCSWSHSNTRKSRNPADGTYWSCRTQKLEDPVNNVPYG